MKSERDEREELTREDAQWVERLRTLYAPEPLDGARRTAFDARLRERLERRRWSIPWLPALGATTLAALLVWNALPGVRPQTTAGAPVAKATPVASATPVAKATSPETRWERNLLYGDPARQGTSKSKELPPEYQAIELAFFDDGAV